MASKQLGKLRQWAGEVISARDKTSVSEEFKDLERDIELRRLGNWRLQITSADYQQSIIKKKDSEALLDEKEKLLPIDAFGIVMIQHGEEFGDESAYGLSLVSLGKAHCKLAALQETFAVAFEDTFLNSIVQTAEEIKEYQKERKKLESRRLTYDAAIVKLDKLKGSKKEKERKEGEDEYEKARERYEETETDVYDRMTMIQENEVLQLKDLTNLLDIEIAFAQQHVDVLREVRQSWVDDEIISQLESTLKTQRPIPLAHPSISSQTTPESSFVSVSKRGSVKDASSDSTSDTENAKSTGSFRSRAKSFTRHKSDASASRPGSRPQSRAEDRKKRSRTDSNATATTPSDRDKDRDSDEDGEDKATEKEKTSKRKIMAGWASSKMPSISLGIGRKDKEKEKERDRDKFSALADDGDGSNSDDDERQRSRDNESSRSSPVKRSRSKSLSKSKSAATTPNASPKITTRMLRRQSTSQTSSPHGSPITPASFVGKRKLVEAVQDFTASTTTELSFKAGDTILVMNEVLDDWWIGEVQNGSGKKGLIPLSRTRTVVQPSHSSSSSSLSMLAPAMTRRKSKSGPKPEKLSDALLLAPSEDDTSAYEVSPMDMTPQVIHHSDSYGYVPPSASDTEDERHPFGDHHEAPTYQSSGATNTSVFSTDSRNSFAESFESSVSGHIHDEQESLMPSSSDSLDLLELTPSSKPAYKRSSSNLLIPSSGIAPPLPARRHPDSTSSSGVSTPILSGSPSLQARKAPPPPPPPRRPSSVGLTTPPILPARPATLPNTRTNSSQSISSGGSYGSNSSLAAVARSTAAGPAVSAVGPLHLNVRLREEADELTYSPFDSPRDQTKFKVGCAAFRQNPFKQKGFCDNCYQVHG